MKIKRFFAKDMRAALAEVKETLGSDAVIMSSKKVTGGIEIVAAIDPEQHPAPAPAQPAPQTQMGRPLEDDTVDLSSFKKRLNAAARVSAENHRATPRATQSHSAQPQAAPPANNDSLQSLLMKKHNQLHGGQLQRSAPTQPAAPHMNMHAPQPHRTPVSQTVPGANERYATEVAQMREEMHALRQLLEHQVSGLMWQEMERQEPLRAMLVGQLKKMGLADELADQFACYINESSTASQAWQQLQQLIAEQMIVTDDEIVREGGVVALLGPTGVGKTTTVAKLAARYASIYGSEQVALITTDSYRIGAMEQLATYGKILNCPVRQAKNADELSEILHQFRNRKLILIDTAGMGQRDMRLNEQLNTLMRNTRVKIRSYLVLAATAQRAVMQESVEQFRRIPLRGCILTKLDESLSLGECISVAIQNSLPIGYLSDGQRVPEDLKVANAELLVQMATEQLSNEQGLHADWTTQMTGGQLGL